MSIYKQRIGVFTIVLFLSIIWVISFPVISSAECRFWAAISDEIPTEVIKDHLLKLPNSLKALALSNPDGWGIGYYDNAKARLLKGDIPADEDQLFEKSVLKVSSLRPKVAVAHIRRATSGCRDVANPHPFKRYKNGKYWLFGHNGTISKKILIDLIGQEYLDKNSPNVCIYDAPNSWVDSELYFIFLLKCIEENQWNVESGIREGILELKSMMPGSNRGLNFFLTDGDILWSFRRGNSLYYYDHPDLRYSLVASMFPGNYQEEWIEVSENSLVVMKPGSSSVLQLISAPVAQLDRASAF